MTFAEIQNELISVPAARFKETQRASVKRWINDRYAELWGLEDWTFRKGTVTLPVVGNNATATVPADFGRPIGIWGADGTRMTWVEPRAYYDASTSTTSTGTTNGFTIVNGQVLLYPTPSANANYTLLYDKRLTLLSADGDIPAFPVEHHYLLVHGATATGSVQVNDFTYQFAEQRWTTGIDSMRRNWLADQTDETQQWGSYMTA